MTDPNLKEQPFNYEGWTENYYLVTFYCTNCNKHFNYLLRKGVKQKGVKVDCKNCGCEGKLR